MFVDLIEGSIIVIKVEVSLEHGRSLRSILIYCAKDRTDVRLKYYLVNL
jgi:hypothetical protein